MLAKDGVLSWFLCILERQVLPSLPFLKKGCEVRDKAGIRTDVKHHFHWSENKTYFCSDSHLQNPTENCLHSPSEFYPWKLTAPVWNPNSVFCQKGKAPAWHSWYFQGKKQESGKATSIPKMVIPSLLLHTLNKVKPKLFCFFTAHQWKNHANLCKQFETKSKNTSFPFPNCAYRNGKHPLRDYIPPCTRIWQSMNLWTAAYLRIQALV